MTKPALNKELIKTVETAMTGKRLEKFQKSVQLITESLEANGWLKGASRSADSGFYQGIISGRIPEIRNLEDKRPFRIYMSLRYGHGGVATSEATREILKELREIADPKEHKAFLKLSDQQLMAWLDLSNQKANAVEWLNSARPVPVITDMGASPKVLRTLEEMGMTVNASSLKYPELERKVQEYEAINPRTGEMQTFKHVYYEIKWEKGIVHNTSRFAGTAPSGHCRCDACGKSIPSGMLVPLEGKDNDGKWKSMMVGTDCAQTLFGVKDVGIDTNVNETIEKAKTMAQNRRNQYMSETGRK
jgi:hypothetical protein